MEDANLLREPVHGKCDKDDQANDLAVATASSPVVTGRVVARMVVGVNCDQSDREPGAEGHRN